MLLSGIDVSEKAAKVSKTTNAMYVRRLPTPLKTFFSFLRWYPLRHRRSEIIDPLGRQHLLSDRLLCFEFLGPTRVGRHGRVKVLAAKIAAKNYQRNEGSGQSRNEKQDRKTVRQALTAPMPSLSIFQRIRAYFLPPSSPWYLPPFHGT
ncbi:hypothetical protein TNCV_2329761 [Trichonephila clavipes]|nr:hypothetical protein TNCV_2329761 [Trichonephila clavipes]